MKPASPHLDSASSSSSTAFPLHASESILPPIPAGAIQELMAALAPQLSPSTLIRQQEPLAKRTTLRVGGPADLFVEPSTENDLALVLRAAAQCSVPIRVVGRGSNLLVRDGGVRGCVISMGHSAFAVITVRDQQIHCGAGAKLKAAAMEAKRHGLAGLEFLEGIPGSVGGALRMNAGAMGNSTFEILHSVRFMDPKGQVHECSADDLIAEYRSCPHFETHIALAATFNGTPAPRDLIEAKMAACSRKRWQSQPAAPSAGCIFKNPLTIPAGKLIEELGLKGTRVGGAEVSTVHGNFIVNTGAATATDVLDLIRLIQEKASAQRGIDLLTEVEIIGDNTLPV